MMRSTRWFLYVGVFCLMSASCNGHEAQSAPKESQPATTQPASTGATSPAKTNGATATFAGGCFWCMQPPFDDLNGVVSTAVGYMGGHVDNPTYEQVCSGTTGHAEAIQIVYDPQRVSYDQLLDIFWRSIDPTTLNRQFADAGTQYRTAIFYHDDQQKQAAEASKKKLDDSGKFDAPIVTAISPASVFYRAQDYHQKYYVKCPIRYQSYKKGSGRQGYLEDTWGSQ